MLQELPFTPLPFFTSPHAQTLLSAMPTPQRTLRASTVIVQLSDGDQIACRVSTPKSWQPHHPTAVLVHGLCGSHRSSHLVRLTNKVFRRGYRVVRVNMRGCGAGQGLARMMYHGGKSDDILEVVKLLKHQTPDSEILCVGFSLGGNLVLKMGGDLAEETKSLVSRVIAVCPPIDLETCSKRLGYRQNRIYERYFINNLMANLRFRHRLFDIPKIDLPKKLSMTQFDHLYLTKHWGFNSGKHYYHAASSLYVLDKIIVPCDILFSLDDPIIDCSMIKEINLPDNVNVWTTQAGGHMGFFGIPGRRGGMRWLDTQLMHWIFDGDNRIAD